MKRASVVAGATFVGLAGVLGFHTKPASHLLTLPGAASTSNTASAPKTTSPSTTTPNSSGISPSSGGSSTTSPTTTVPSAQIRSAVGSPVNYNYGILSVAVKASGKKLTSVSIASIDDGGNFRSQSIDQQSIPMLEQQALQAQSANIQGVSGASYTTAGFAQSLQSALGKLGIG
jgi:uncharacterized protein with FMN-binding domain